ncbi:MAG: hypothetical protein KC613_06390, partial [Myxococcales bacterium]|nr:hypothetical protein [Myxococcales bacterium]
QVDGAGSGIDADLLDGLSSGSFLRRDLAATSKPNVTSRLHVMGDHTDLGRTGETGLRFRNDGTKHAAIRFDGIRTLFVEDASRSDAVPGGGWSAASVTDLEIRNGSLRVNGSQATTGNATVDGFIQPSAGNGNNGIIFPANPGGGSGDISWIRTYSEGGENLALEIGISNDADDNIRLNAAGGVDVVGSGQLRTTSDIRGGRDIQANRDLNASRNVNASGNVSANGRVTAGRNGSGYNFPNAGDDYAWLRFVDQGGDNRALQLGVGNDVDDDVEIYAPGGLTLAAPGQTPMRIEFPDNRWGGTGDDAWIRYYSEGGENTALEIGIGNEADDNLILNASGGVTIAGNGDLVVNRNLVVRGNCVGCENPAAGGYKPIYASFGTGDNGIVFPNQAGSDDAWIRYFSEGGTNHQLQIGVNNDTDDEIELYARAPVQLDGPGGGTLGFRFRDAYYGGNDRAHIYYFSESGTNTKLRIANYDDSDDDIEFYSNAMMNIAGPGSNPIGFQFQANRFDSSGTAWIRYESEGSNNSRLHIGISNDSNDDMLLNATGGVTITNRLTVSGASALNGNTSVSGAMTVTSTLRGDVDVYAGRDMYVTRNLDVNGSADVLYDLRVRRDLRVDRNLSIAGALSATDLTASRDVNAGRWVNGGAGFQTGGLYIRNNGTIEMPATCCSDPYYRKLMLYGNRWNYSMGVESSSLVFTGGQYHRFYYDNGGVRTQGLYLNNGELYGLRGMDMTGTADFRSVTNMRSTLNTYGTLQGHSTVDFNGSTYLDGRVYTRGDNVYLQNTRTYSYNTMYFGSAEWSTYIQGRNGRNYFEDAENAGPLRVGAVWSHPGIYAEGGRNLAIGSQGGNTYIGEPQGTYGSQDIRGDQAIFRDVYVNGTWMDGWKNTINTRVANLEARPVGGTSGDATCPGGWIPYGDLCFLDSRRGSHNWGVGDYWCRAQVGGHMCTDAEVSGIRGWRGWFGGNFWYADAYTDDGALFHNCNCSGYWYNHDGGANKGDSRAAYCCRSR